MSAPTADEVLAGVDLRGRAFWVTGGDSGIGFETAAALARAGGCVVLGCLRAAEGEAAAERIRATRPDATVRVAAFDLGDRAQVHAATDAAPEPTFDAVVCNAGVYGGPYAETADGFERTFGVCYVGHVRLVDRLLPRLRPGARVVAVSSENHRWPPRLDLARLPPRREDYSELRAYGVAKLCVNLWARAFARRSGAPGVTANAVHPGDLVSTGIDRDSWVLRTVFRLARPFTWTPAQAAATSVWVATAPELAGVTGRYFVDRTEKDPSRAARDDGLADALWELTRGWLASKSSGPVT